MKKTIFVILSVLSLAACSDPEWLRAGSSVGLDRSGWESASQEVRLGTSGYWLKSLQDKGWLNDESITEQSDLKKNAQALTDCINQSVAISKDDMNYIVADCVTLLGWSED